MEDHPQRRTIPGDVVDVVFSQHGVEFGHFSERWEASKRFVDILDCQRCYCFTLRMGAGLLISLAELITLENFHEEDD